MTPTEPPDDLSRISAIELAGRIAAKAVSPVEVTDWFLARIEERNPSINAFVFVAHDGARSDAQESAHRIAAGNGRALEGVPIAIKDDTVVAGMPTSNGTAMIDSVVAPVDAHLVGRLRDAGAIILGKTNLPEFGTIAVTESVRWGACRNPWDRTRTPGGSSGGSAAAVASGMATAAHGCDGGGSLRIPASCCGLFTIKPTRGRLSVAPYSSDSPLTCHGFVTRSVADNALMLDLTRGNVPGDLFWANDPPLSYVEEVRRASAGPRLKIAWTTQPPLDVAVHPACAQAVRDAAAACAELGHTVVERAPAWRDASADADFLQLWSILIGSFAESLIAEGGDITRAEPHNRALLESARAMPSTAYFAVAGKLQEAARRILVTWNTYDVVLTPTLAQLPLPIGALFNNPADPMAVMTAAFAFTPFTPMVNVTGQPAAQIPLSWHEGLPIGVQAIGRQGDEATLLRLSAELEHLRPWRGQVSPALIG